MPAREPDVLKEAHANGTIQEAFTRSSYAPQQSFLSVLRGIQRQEFVIGGFTDPAMGRIGLGAILVGVYATDGRLTCAGKVGTGFNAAMLARLRKRMNEIEQGTPPFHNRLAGQRIGARTG